MPNHTHPLTDIDAPFARADIICIYNLDITDTLYGPGENVTREQKAAAHVASPNSKL